jgi:hypothetical protein
MTTKEWLERCKVASFEDRRRPPTKGMYVDGSQKSGKGKKHILS